MSNSLEKLGCVIFAINCAAFWKYIFFVPGTLFSYNYLVTLSGFAEIICPIVFIISLSGVGAKNKNFNYIAIAICAIGIAIHLPILNYGAFSASILIIFGLCFSNIIILLLFKGQYIKINYDIFIICSNTYLICHFFWFLEIARSNGSIFFGNFMLILYTLTVLALLVYCFLEHNGIILANYNLNYYQVFCISIFGIILTIIAQTINPKIPNYFWFSSIIPISFVLRHVKKTFSSKQGTSIIHL